MAQQSTAVLIKYDIHCNILGSLYSIECSTKLSYHVHMLYVCLITPVQNTVNVYCKLQTSQEWAAIYNSI